MKVNLWEDRYCSEVTLIPEDVREVSMLVRSCMNAKKEPINISIHFNEDTVRLNILITKRRPEIQTNYITNDIT